MKFNDTEIIVKKGDITQEDTQAIVNPANDRLVMGGGLALAIKKKGGQEIEDEAAKLGPIGVGQACITKAGSLKAQYVIHAATMAMDFKTDQYKIRKSTSSALKVAQDKGLSSISFSALGCGVGKFSYKDSAKIMAQEVLKHLRDSKKVIIKNQGAIFVGKNIDEAEKLILEEIK